MRVVEKCMDNIGMTLATLRLACTTRMLKVTLEDPVAV
jgi:hypothetical protein